MKSVRTSNKKKMSKTMKQKLKKGSTTSTSKSTELDDKRQTEIMFRIAEKGIYSDDLKMQIDATVYLRKILSAPSPPIEDIVRFNWQNRLVHFLSSNNLQLQGM